MVAPISPAGGGSVNASSGDVKAAYIFVGDDPYFKEKALARLEESVLDKGSRDLNYSLFYGDEASALEILQSARTAPFLREKRLVVVKRSEELGEEGLKAISDYITNPAVHTCLVLDAKDDSILSHLPSQCRHMDVARFDKRSGSDLSAWIRTALRERGKSIDSSTLEFMAEIFSESDYNFLEGEIDKIASFAGSRSQVNAEDVEKLASGTSVYSVFDLTDSIGRRDADSAFRALRGMLEASAVKYAEIIGLVAWRFKTLLRARLLLESGKSESYVRSGLKLPRRLHNDFIQQVKSQSSKGIQSDLEALLEADVDIKTGRMEPKACLEAAVLNLCLR